MVDIASLSLSDKETISSSEYPIYSKTATLLFIFFAALNRNPPANTSKKPSLLTAHNALVFSKPYLSIRSDNFLTESSGAFCLVFNGLNLHFDIKTFCF